MPFEREQFLLLLLLLLLLREHRLKDRWARSSSKWLGRSSWLLRSKGPEVAVICMLCLLDPQPKGEGPNLPFSHESGAHHSETRAYTCMRGGAMAST